MYNIDSGIEVSRWGAIGLSLRSGIVRPAERAASWLWWSFGVAALMLSAVFWGITGTAIFSWGLLLGFIVCAAARQSSEQFVRRAAENDPSILAMLEKAKLAVTRKLGETEIERIIHAYGAVLERNNGALRPDTDLPIGKHRLQEILLDTLIRSANYEQKTAIRAGLLYLPDFQQMSPKELRAVKLHNTILLRKTVSNAGLIHQANVISHTAEAIEAIEQRAFKERSNIIALIDGV